MGRIFEPERKIIIFGDGAQGRVVNEDWEHVDLRGNRFITFLIDPHPRTIEHYNLSGELDSDGYVKRTYPFGNVIPATEGILNSVIITSTLNWRETKLSDRLYWMIEINNLRNTIKSLKRCLAEKDQFINRSLLNMRYFAEQSHNITKAFKGKQDSNADDMVESENIKYPQGGQK